MDIGYGFWGFLADKRPEDSPDGCATYAWAIIYHLLDRDHRVYSLQPNRDQEVVGKLGREAFALFETEKRWSAYTNIDATPPQYADQLDAVIWEWRFPISYRNIGPDHPNPDLDNQLKLLETLEDSDTQLYICDFDHKLILGEEQLLKHRFKKTPIVLEPSFIPRKTILPRQTFFFPFSAPEPLVISKRQRAEYRELVYVGSRYERDEAIDTYIAPYTEKNPYKTWFYGNWRKYHHQFLDSVRRWPNIQFHDRVDLERFEWAFGGASASPLLTKDSYAKRGFFGTRAIECMYFGGVLPIGFRNHQHIDSVLPFNLIADDRDYPLESVMHYIRSLNSDEYADKLMEVWGKVMKMHDPETNMDAILNGV